MARLARLASRSWKPLLLMALQFGGSVFWSSVDLKNMYLPSLAQGAALQLLLGFLALRHLRLRVPLTMCSLLPPLALWVASLLCPSRLWHCSLPGFFDGSLSMCGEIYYPPLSTIMVVPWLLAWLWAGWAGASLVSNWKEETAEATPNNG